MNTKHRWYDVIVAWANGEKIQVKSTTYKDEWEDFEGNDPVWCDSEWEWRIKPRMTTKKYRMALVNMYGGIKVKEPYVTTIDVTRSSIDDPAEYSIQGFIRWVGDIVEVEIESD